MDIIPVLLGLASTLAGVIAGQLLALRSQRFAWKREDERRLKQREQAQRIDFSVEIRFVAIQGSSWVVELAALLNNKGLVRYETSHLSFDLRCLYPDDGLKQGGPDIDGQILVPHQLAEGSWLPSTWHRTFIEPGLATRYSYVWAVPCHAVAVLLHGRFEYEGDGTTGSVHTAESLQAVPKAADAGTHVPKVPS